MTTSSDLHSLQTKEFIDASPIDLVMSRQSLVGDGAGGKKSSGVLTLPSQRVRVVGSANPAGLVGTEGKPDPRAKSVVGMSDLDIEQQDTFEYKGQIFEVLNVERDPEWRVLASAVRRG